MAKKSEGWAIFDYEACDLCGECLARRRYLGLDPVEAVQEMKRLVTGEPSRLVHRRCISCYACDAFCPRDCHPYE